MKSYSKEVMFIMYTIKIELIFLSHSSYRKKVYIYFLHLIKSDILKIFVTKVFAYLKFFATLSISIISTNLINQKIHFYDEMMLIKGRSSVLQNLLKKD